MKHDPERRRKGSGPSNSPRRNSLGKGHRQEKVLQERKFQPTCFSNRKGDCAKRNACDYWHPPECSFHQTGKCKLGSKCALKHTERLVANQRNGRIPCSDLTHQAHRKKNFAKMRGEGIPSARDVSDFSEIKCTGRGEGYCQ